MIVHDLKTLEQHWDEIWIGQKKAELRFDDRGFQVGNLLNLIRIRMTPDSSSGANWVYSPIWIPAGYGPSREIRAQLVRVTHILRHSSMVKLGCRNGVGLEEGWCILSFEPVTAFLAAI